MQNMGSSLSHNQIPSMVPLTQVPNISRGTLKIVFDLASSEKDKQLIKYAVCCTSNMSTQTARKAYGTSNLTSPKQKVESAVEQALEIRDAVNYLSSVKESCNLEELGIHINDSTSDSHASESSEICESDRSDGCDDVDSEKSNPSILDPNITMKEMAFVSPAPAKELSETSESDRSHGCDDVDSEKK